MTRPFALTLLLASTLVPLGRAQEPTAAVTAPATPLVTYDVAGTFPANMPVSRMTAPNAAFVIEISFPQTVPAITDSTLNFGANAARYCQMLCTG